ncbi:MAG: hypothetical protein ACO1N9_08390 [Flavobacterium sp.]
METLFQKKIADSTAHRPIRDEISGMVINNLTLLPEIMEMALDMKNKNHHKACWSLELVMEEDIKWLHPYLEIFCDTLHKYRHEGAMRSVSKIGMFAAIEDNLHDGFLTGAMRQKMTEACFDWLIGDIKVATKAYAMRALFYLGKKDDWIYPELKVILQQDFPNHSAAYKAAAKDLLRKI